MMRVQVRGSSFVSGYTLGTKRRKEHSHFRVLILNVLFFDVNVVLCFGLNLPSYLNSNFSLSPNFFAFSHAHTLVCRGFTVLPRMKYSYVHKLLNMHCLHTSYMLLYGHLKQILYNIDINDKIHTDDLI